MKKIIFLVSIFIGIFAVIFGEADDSPGLQGLGLILIILTLARTFKNRFKK